MAGGADGCGDCNFNCALECNYVCKETTSYSIPELNSNCTNCEVECNAVDNFWAWTENCHAFGSLTGFTCTTGTCQTICYHLTGFSDPCGNTCGGVCSNPNGQFAGSARCAEYTMTVSCNSYCYKTCYGIVDSQHTDCTNGWGEDKHPTNGESCGFRCTSLCDQYCALEAGMHNPNCNPAGMTNVCTDGSSTNPADEGGGGSGGADQYCNCGTEGSSGGGCTATCRQDCNGHCHTAHCTTECDTTTCKMNCRLDCLDVTCSAICSEKCSEYCSSCANLCDMNCGPCTSVCSVKCGSYSGMVGCNVTCTAACREKCDTECVLSCVSTCGGCSNLCYSCVGQCIGTCSVRCESTCSMCANLCGFWCDTSCNRDCMTDCNDRCIQTCVGQCVTFLRSNTTANISENVGHTYPTSLGWSSANREQQRNSFIKTKK